MKLGLLHIAPTLGDLAHNRALIERGIVQAAEHGADWIVTPELCQTGYDFSEAMGTDWIEPQPDPWMRHCMNLASRLKAVLFLAAAELDPSTQKRHNSLFVIGRDGALLGRHRKVSVIPVIEGWATPGTDMQIVDVDGIKVGLLICADAYRAGPTARLKELGAEMLISSSAWSPKPHGPEGAWEQRSQETGLPLFVCNRTGMDHRLDFSDSETGLYHQGKCLMRHVSSGSAMVLVEWSVAESILVNQVILPIRQ